MATRKKAGSASSSCGTVCGDASTRSKIENFLGEKNAAWTLIHAAYPSLSSQNV
jgi:hypothetical protein